MNSKEKKHKVFFYLNYQFHCYEFTEIYIIIMFQLFINHNEYSHKNKGQLRNLSYYKKKIFTYWFFSLYGIIFVEFFAFSTNSSYRLFLI